MATLRHGRSRNVQLVYSRANGRQARRLEPSENTSLSIQAGWGSRTKAIHIVI